MHRKAAVQRVVSRQLRSSGREIGDQMRSKKLFLTIVATIIAMMILVPFFTYTSIAASFANQIVDSTEKLTKSQAIIVFSESEMDKDWGLVVEKAADILKSGKSKQLIIIGDTTKAAQITGINPNQIDTDRGDADLFTDCKMLRFEKDVTDAVLLAPGYLLHRMLYVCSAAGIQLQGMAVPDSSGNDNISTRIKEIWQAPASFWRVNFVR